MASFVLSTDGRDDIANEVNTFLSEGVLRIYSGTSPGPNEAATGDLLAEFDLPASGSNTILNGVITFGAIADTVGLADDDAGYFRLLKNDGTTVFADGDVNTTGAAFNLNMVSIVTGGPVVVLSGTITVPAGT